MARRIRAGKKVPMTQKLISECKEFNKGLSPRLRKSLEQFVAYKYGYSVSQVTTRVAPQEEQLYRRPEQKIPSHGSSFCPGETKVNTYTGDVIQGVATMHKSNAVPIINQQQAEDCASMRR